MCWKREVGARGISMAGMLLGTSSNPLKRSRRAKYTPDRELLVLRYRVCHLSEPAAAGESNNPFVGKTGWEVYIQHVETRHAASQTREIATPIL
jgi:hypothetical protein